MARAGAVLGHFLRFLTGFFVIFALSECRTYRLVKIQTREEVMFSVSDAERSSFAEGAAGTGRRPNCPKTGSGDAFTLAMDGDKLEFGK